MYSFLLNTFLYQSPKIKFKEDEVIRYEKLIHNMYEGQKICEKLSFPPHRFLHYLSQTGDFVFHGSNNTEIDVFDPRKQTLFNGKITKAVFASTEPYWSMFYAVFDRDKLRGSFRNGCLVYKNKKYHYYSLNKATLRNNPWTTGKIYILPKSKFQLADTRRIYFDEWISHDFIRPIGEIEVREEDFYFINKVSTHQPKDSFVKTLLLYKMHIWRNKERGV